MQTNSWDKRADMLVYEHEPFNAESPSAALAESRLTGADAFYVRNHGPVPEGDEDGWRIVVDGLVRRPLRLSLEDLRERFTQHEVVATLQCAGNRRSGLQRIGDIPGHPWGAGATSTAVWKGVRLTEVLEAAGVRDSAGHIAFAAPDIAPEAEPPQRFGASIPLTKARQSEVLLALTMNGNPLPPVHGAPVRVVVPGYIGARSVKWVDHITVAAEPSANFFQSLAYRILGRDIDPTDAEPGPHGALGPMPVNSAVLQPGDGDRLAAGSHTITGYALPCEGNRIAEVEVSVDGGRTWRQAELDTPPNAWTWCRWQITAELHRGHTEIICRARDSADNEQPRAQAELWNPKGYGNNAWFRTSVEVTEPG
ncbi:sulfite oxidase [Sciscionella sediminilitoris]|uniref:sulfite oxidase n=1 Tax=Sciscionella sediminilitoris TaxID=1445613 RepID=UPI0004DF9619|nr:sulfite oxidase [Sciscionella sp. SE31]